MGSRQKKAGAAVASRRSPRWPAGTVKHRRGHRGWPRRGADQPRVTSIWPGSAPATLTSLTTPSIRQVSPPGPRAASVPSGGAQTPCRPLCGDHQKPAPDHLTPHSLRHTFGSWCTLGGLSARKLQLFLGHKSVTTTERYSHLGNAGVHPAYVRLANFFNEFVPTGLPSEPTEEEKREQEELQMIENTWWRRADSNCGPRDYETLALAS